MPNTNTLPIDHQKRTGLLALLANGDMLAFEAEIDRLSNTAGANLKQQLLDEFSHSSAGLAIVAQLKAKEAYRRVRLSQVQVTLSGQQKATIATHYALARTRKRGPKRPGRNGSGTHVLLAYLGFMDKHSPASYLELARAGASAASYDLAAQNLVAQGVAAVQSLVDRMSQKVGTIAVASRPHHLALAEGETLAGKRVAIYLDGGRIRTRTVKAGRRKKGRKRHGYATDWKEPKVLAIVELDAQGKKLKGAKPLYEATMASWDELYRLLLSLAHQLNLKQAAEIVLLGDGAKTLWSVFARLRRTLRISGKTTEVVDFFHACEHLQTLLDQCSDLTKRQKRIRYKDLKELLLDGKLTTFLKQLRQLAKAQKVDLEPSLQYFENHRHRMRYDRYKAAALPIGSGIIESVIRQVVNGRLKAPGTFWKPDNVEHMLALRCALLAGRWATFSSNLVVALRLRPCLGDSG